MVLFNLFVYFEQQLQIMSKLFNYGIDQLTISRVLAIAAGKMKGVLNAEAIKKINDSHQHVQQIIKENKTVDRKSVV